MLINPELDNPVNIALNKTVMVSSSLENGGWLMEHLVDGIRETNPARKGWSSVLGIPVNKRCREWIMIDTEAIYRINRVDIYPAEDGFPVDFRIQVSEDKVVWADVVVKMNYVLFGNSVQNFIFNPVNARYVRIVGTKLREAGTDSVMRLSEIEIYPVPKTSSLSANIILTADESGILYINGVQAANGLSREKARSVDFELKKGINVIAAEVKNSGTNPHGYGGLAAQITIDGKMFFITNEMWKLSPEGPHGWKDINFDDNNWEFACDHGPYGKFPWKYDIPEMPKDSLARWIWHSDEKYTGKLFFRFTVKMNSETGEVTARQPSERTPPDFRKLVFPPVSYPLWKLAEDGVPRFVIVKNPNADETEDFAAEELRYYLGRMIGTNPQIVTKPDSTKINIVAGTPSTDTEIVNILDNAGITINSDSCGYDGYIVKALNCLDNKIILISGSKSRSVLFGVYYLLENLGCRFYGPKTVPSNEIVPDTPNLFVGNIDEVRKPVTKFRMMSNGSYYASNTATLEYMADWGIKNGYNSILLTLRLKNPDGNFYNPWEPYDPSPLTKRGFEIMMAGHNWAGFVDTSDKAWYTKEENVETFLKNVKAYAEGHPEAAGIGAWQMDGPKGKIRIEHEGEDGTQLWRFTEWNLYLMNRIAQDFRAEGINKRVMWMTYVESNRPPDFILPDPLIDIYYYHQFQNYHAPLNSPAGEKQVDWSLNDWYRRPQNSDWADEPIPDLLLAQKPVVNTWSKYLSGINFQGDAVLVDHISTGIGITLKYPAISYTNLGPVYSLEEDRRYEREQGFNGYTNCFGHGDYSDNYNPVNPDPYLHRRMAEALWDDISGRNIRDSDFYYHFYGEKYAVKIMQFFDQVYFEALADKRDYHSVKNCMGNLFTAINGLRKAIINDEEMSPEQKARIETVYNWYTRRVIPYKLQYYNRGSFVPEMIF